MGLSVSKFEQSVNYRVKRIEKMDSNIIEHRISKLAIELNMNEFEQSVNYKVKCIESGFEYIRASIIKISNKIKYE